MSMMEKLLRDYRLTTAEIFYHLPDHPLLLQSYIWQELDQSPDFPILQKFLHFWDRKLEGKVHSVSVTHCEIIKPAEITIANGEICLH
jgi:uncharacterized protein Usg